MPNNNFIALTGEQIRWLNRLIDAQDPAIVKIEDTNATGVIVATYTDSYGDKHQVLVSGNGHTMELAE